MSGTAVRWSRSGLRHLAERGRLVHMGPKLWDVWAGWTGVTREKSAGCPGVTSAPEACRVPPPEIVHIRSAEHSLPWRRRADEAARVRDLLRIEIGAGRWGHRGVLPSEAELTLEYAVSRNTVRNSLDLLRKEGLIKRVQGSGTFVLATKSVHRFDRVHAIHEAVGRSGNVDGQVLAHFDVAAPYSVARRLGIPAGTACVFIEYTAVISGEPFSVSSSYLSRTIGSRIDSSVFAGDFYELLEHAGYRVDSGELAVEASVADARSAAALHVGPGTPLITFQRTLFGPTGQPLEFGLVRCRGDRVSLQVQLPRSSPREKGCSS